MHSSCMVELHPDIVAELESMDLMNIILTKADYKRLLLIKKRHDKLVLKKKSLISEDDMI